jgi:hypothetical protein
LLPSLLALKMDAAYFSETSVNFYQTTWRHNPNDSIFMHRKDLHSSNAMFLSNLNRHTAILGILVIFLGLSRQRPE